MMAACKQEQFPHAPVKTKANNKILSVSPVVDSFHIEYSLTIDRTFESS